MFEVIRKSDSKYLGFHEDQRRAMLTIAFPDMSGESFEEQQRLSWPYLNEYQGYLNEVKEAYSIEYSASRKHKEALKIKILELSKEKERPFFKDLIDAEPLTFERKQKEYEAYLDDNQTSCPRLLQEMNKRNDYTDFDLFVTEKVAPKIDYYNNFVSSLIALQGNLERELETLTDDVLLEYFNGSFKTHFDEQFVLTLDL